MKMGFGDTNDAMDAEAYIITKGGPLGDILSLSCEASVGTSGSNN